ncbi:MAG: trigger factor [Firmicutes bacterium]|nr:trigger factor [Bacillota bacterium]
MKNVHEIEIKLEGEKWAKCLDNAFKKVNKDIKIDGFRKGAAPKDIYLKKYGVESLYSEAINEAINVAYKELLENNDLKPIIEPAVDVTGISDGSVIFKFTIITKPEIKLTSYKNLGVKKEKVKVSKEELQAEIDVLRSQLAEVVVKENGVVADGDTVVIDFDGYVDGKALEGGKGENYPLEIGSHTFIPGFEEGLVGKKTGEETELNLVFPENYVEDLKNKAVTFKVKIHEIKTRVLPEINEDFYADLGLEDVKTVEDFEKEVEKTIKDRKEAELEDKFVEDLLQAASEKLEVEINPEIISEEVHRMIDGYANQLKAQGIDMEQYFQLTGTSHEDLHKQMEPEAVKRIKYRYVIEEIAELEKIDFTEEEVEAKAKEMADNYGIKVEELINAYGTIDVVKYDMKMHRALEILKENNK